MRVWGLGFRDQDFRVRVQGFWAKGLGYGKIK